MPRAWWSSPAERARARRSAVWARFQGTRAVIGTKRLPTTFETARAPRAKPMACFRPSGCLILTIRKVTDTAPNQTAIDLWAYERVGESGPCPGPDSPSSGPSDDPDDGEGHR